MSIPSLLGLAVVVVGIHAIHAAPAHSAATQPTLPEIPTPAPGFAVMPFLQRMTQSGVSIVWETTEPARAHVEYGRATLGDNAPRLDQTAPALPADQRPLNTTHTVRIEGLQTGSPYFYRAVTVTSSGRRIEGEIRTFKTAVADDAPYAFAIFGDSQDNPVVWHKVSTHAYAERPDFAIHAGDIVGDGNRYQDWTEEFFPSGYQFMSRVPLFTVLGNHENDADHYYRYFDNPAPEFFYTFDYGNARFFMVDSNRPLIVASETYEWLDYQLSRSDKLWNIVVHHHPPYSADADDYGDTSKADALEGDPDVADAIALYEKYNVDLVFYGHIHDYERSWPIRAGRVDLVSGVRYMQVGGAGGGLEDYAPTRRWHTAKVRRTHHFAIARVFDARFEFQAFDEDWRLFDQFTIDKTPRAANRAQFADTVPPPAPVITPESSHVIGPASIELRSPVEGLPIHYSTDGSIPTPASPRYSAPFRILGGETVSARVIPAQGTPSRVSTVVYRDRTPIQPITAPATTPGLRFQYFEGRWPDTLALAQDTPIRSGAIARPSITDAGARPDGFGMIFTGFITIPADGVWTFETRSDDGSRVYVGGVEAVNNDGSHAPRLRKGVLALAAGVHPFRLTFFENGGGEELDIFWTGPGTEHQPIPASAFSHTAE